MAVAAALSDEARPGTCHAAVPGPGRRAGSRPSPQGVPRHGL